MNQKHLNNGLKAMYQVNHRWLYGAVKPHFERQGINLLRDDMLFIEKCLGNIPTDRQRLVMRDYLSIWSATITENKSVEPVKINARYEANCYLRSAESEIKSL